MSLISFHLHSKPWVNLIDWHKSWGLIKIHQLERIHSHIFASVWIKPLYWSLINVIFDFLINIFRFQFWCVFHACHLLLHLYFTALECGMVWFLFWINFRFLQFFWLGLILRLLIFNVFNCFKNSLVFYSFLSFFHLDLGFKTSVYHLG